MQIEREKLNHEGDGGSNKATLLLADDHLVVLSGLQLILNNDFNIVGAVANGRELVAAAIKLHPDLILTDISMPELNGIEALVELRRAGVMSKVVLLTMHIDATYAGRALEAGAHGFVLKHETAAVVVKALKGALRGEVFLSQEIAGALDATANRMGDKDPSLMGRLTERQLEVLKLVVEGCSAKQIAKKLSISPRTAEFHKYRIMEILNVKTNAELVSYAMRHGIV